MCSCLSIVKPLTRVIFIYKLIWFDFSPSDTWNDWDFLTKFSRLVFESVAVGPRRMRSHPMRYDWLRCRRLVKLGTWWAQLLFGGSCIRDILNTSSHFGKWHSPRDNQWYTHIPGPTRLSNLFRSLEKWLFFSFYFFYFFVNPHSMVKKNLCLYIAIYMGLIIKLYIKE